MILAAFAAFLAIVTPTLSSAAVSSGGGFTVPDPAVIDDVVCLSGCTDMRASSPGGSVQVTGSGLAGTASVSFVGKTGRVDSKVKTSTDSSLEVKVPEDARTGKIRLTSSAGANSGFSGQVLTIGAAQAPGRVARLTITAASATPVRAYQYGRKKPELNFILSGGKKSNDLRIDIKSETDEVVWSKFVRGVPTGSSQRVVWNGRTTARKLAPNGAYTFVVRGVDGTEATLSKSLNRSRRKAKRGQVTDPFTFNLYGYVFPLRGRHSYGDGVGAGRGHQGQDVMAKCGTKLIAARGGVVYYNDYQAEGAGNYLVINVAGPGTKSHVYMHMPVRSPLQVGTRVKTGQKIGVVGTTGRSSACHLHFEIWSSPGWYQGGSFLSPTGALKRWDKYS